MKTLKETLDNISSISNEELLEAFDLFNQQQEAEDSIDCGEFTGGPSDEWYRVHETFMEEIVSRGIYKDLDIL